jgi:alanyl aminopeptidase
MSTAARLSAEPSEGSAPPAKLSAQPGAPTHVCGRGVEQVGRLRTRVSLLPVSLVVAISGLGLGCAGQSAPLGTPTAETPPAPASAAEGPTPPRLRLPEVAQPKRQAVRLRLVPTEEAFTGSTEIDLELRAATDVIWMHAAGLTVSEAELITEGQPTPLRAHSADEYLGLIAAQPIPQGAHRVRLTFSGKLPAREGSGAYRQEENGDWYIFTQFEPLDARRAFPCFDEPSYKIPYQMTLEVRAGDKAFANTPQVSETPTGDMKTVMFSESQPLPSYLVAFAVGPFETLDVGRVGRRSTAVRIIVPKGKTAEAAYAVKTTGEVLTRLESYFDIAYPYEKLDHIAVPQKGGAMENPGPSAATSASPPTSWGTSGSATSSPWPGGTTCGSTRPSPPGSRARWSRAGTPSGRARSSACRAAAR